MLVTNNEDILSRVKIMRLHGINRDIWTRFTEKQANWEYDVVAPGFKYNMPDINAAIGLAQLEKAAVYRAQRQQCAAFYLKTLKECKLIDLPVCNVPAEYHAWHLFPIILHSNQKISRNEFIQKMSEKGIGTSVHYKPLHRMTYYSKKYHLKPGNFPNTEKIWEGTVSLPIYPELRIDELKYICDSVLQILQ